jgi:hypothetical protein
MVEMNIFYMAIYPEQEKVVFNTSMMESMRNLLEEFVPEDKQYADVVRVYDVKEKKLILLSDIVAQEMVCFFDNA